MRASFLIPLAFVVVTAGCGSEPEESGHASTVPQRDLTLQPAPGPDMAVASRLEGYLGGLAAVAAGHVEQLALLTRRPAAERAAAFAAFAFAAALGTAGAAALRLREPARRVKLLVVPAKQELLPAVRAGQRLVWKWHLERLLKLPKSMTASRRFRRGSAWLSAKNSTRVDGVNNNYRRDYNLIADRAA